MMSRRNMLGSSAAVLATVVKVENLDAEYGGLMWNDEDREFKLGERVEVYPSNLDMSTNVYDRCHVARSEQIVDVWPIMGRSGAAR
jgi:D-serine deaminase-like pyridoxal phosphate-dependent protein